MTEGERANTNAKHIRKLRTRVSMFLGMTEGLEKQQGVNSGKDRAMLA
jgi:hypothetical protein